MNRQSARAHRNVFSLALYRLRHLLDEPTSEEKLREMYRLGKQAALDMANRVTEAWRKPQDDVQVPIPQIPAPSIIDGIAGGAPWPGSVGSWTALNAGRAPHRHREPDMLALPPAQNADWLNSKPDVREELFADVVDAEPADDEESEPDDGKTVARTDPALYRLQQMARAKQKGA